MWDSPPVKEAVPLPLWVVRNLELAVADDLSEDEWVLLCCLLMLWNSLNGWTFLQSALAGPRSGGGAGCFGRPVGYSCMLAQFRRCLVHHGGVPLEHVGLFHAPLLEDHCAGLQLCVPEPEKAAQGHHRFNGTAKCVPRYGRNDIIPAIRCQSQVIDAISSGWVPSTPLNRGCFTLEERESAFAEAGATVVPVMQSCVCICPGC